MVDDDQGSGRVAGWTAHTHQDPARVVHPNGEDPVPVRSRTRSGRIMQGDNAQREKRPLLEENDATVSHVGEQLYLRDDTTAACVAFTGFPTVSARMNMSVP